MSIRETALAVGRTAQISVATVADALVGRLTAERCDLRLDGWAHELLRIAQATLEVRGADHVPGGEALVVMSNHRSYYDIPAIFCAIPGRMRMVAKKELFRVPIFGRAMTEAGFVRIDRQARERAIESLARSRQLLAEGVRVWIAPEGTRSLDGRLGPFKSGGFHLALDAKVRILPVAIEGTERIVDPRTVVVRPGARVRVTILPPIDAPSYGHARRKELTAHVRGCIAEALGEPSQVG
jgi:1-acyl-sn-glycerol-3-phosphate acyltransferase